MVAAWRSHCSSTNVCVHTCTTCTRIHLYESSISTRAAHPDIRYAHCFKGKNIARVKYIWPCGRVSPPPTLLSLPLIPLFSVFLLLYILASLWIASFSLFFYFDAFFCFSSEMLYTLPEIEGGSCGNDWHAKTIWLFYTCCVSKYRTAILYAAIVPLA